MKRSRFTKEQNGAQYHSQTQGQIERWHQTLKKRIALNDYGLAGDLKNQINDFFAARENARYHESFKI